MVAPSTIHRFINPSCYPSYSGDGWGRALGLIVQWPWSVIAFLSPISLTCEGPLFLLQGSAGSAASAGTVEWAGVQQGGGWALRMCGRGQWCPLALVLFRNSHWRVNIGLSVTFLAPCRSTRWCSGFTVPFLICRFGSLAWSHGCGLGSSHS